MCVFFLACFISTYIGLLSFESVPVLFSLVAGVSIAGLIVYGTEFWPAIFFATYIAYLLNQVPLVFVILLSLGHVLQAVTGAYLLKRFNFDTKLARVRDITLFIGMSLAVSTIVPTFGYIGVYILEVFQPAELLFFNLSISWSRWWIGMIVSLVVITPFIVHWQHTARINSNREILERAIIFGFILGISILLFWEEIPRLGGISLVYILIIPLIWSALRSGPRLMTLSLFCISFFAISGAILNAQEAESAIQFGQQLFQIEIFLLVLTIIFLVLASSQEELKVANRKLVNNIHELRHTLDRLYTQDRAKNNFLAMIAHELRNPIAPVASHLEVMKIKQYVSPEGMESLSIIETKIESLKRLLDDLLDISRIYENKITLKKKTIDIRDPIISSTQNVSTSISTKKQELITQLPDEVLLVHADPVRLEQIFTNLLFNASKFTENDGHIEISVKRKNDNIVVTVKDDGYGIEPAALPKIFNSFYQGEIAPDSSKAGLGIGLSLTRDLVRLHNGTITAKSEGLYKGSEFQITLPALNSPVVKRKMIRARTAPPHNTKGTRILVVDSNVDTAESITAFLEMIGFEAQYTSTGAEALKKNISFKPHAILLDLTLSDMNGYDVAQILRNEHQFEGTIVAMGGQGGQERLSQDAGHMHHITKPVRLAELISLLK